MKPPGEERDVIAFVADDSNGQLRAKRGAEGRKRGRKRGREGGRKGGKKKKPFRSVATAMMAAARNVFMYRFQGGRRAEYFMGPASFESPPPVFPGHSINILDQKKIRGDYYNPS